MIERLPPLNALRVFEVAARHLSFSAAATELCVTAAAVSHQVRMLEEHVGAPLFIRTSRALALTEAGALLLPDVREAFARLYNAAQGVRRLVQTSTLIVSVPSSFAAKWLVPRLPAFQALFPKLEVTVQTSSALVDFGRDEVDLAIRYGAGNYPGLHSERLAGTSYFPVCSPSVLAGPPPLLDPDDLRHVSLLHDEIPSSLPTTPTWRTWLDAADVRSIDTAHGSKFNTSFFTIEMAAAGMGVALGQDMLVAADLASGRLVRPFDIVTSTPLSYYFVCANGAGAKPSVSVFRAWIVDEMARSRAQLAKLLSSRDAAVPRADRSARRFSERGAHPRLD